MIQQEIDIDNKVNGCAFHQVLHIRQKYWVFQITMWTRLGGQVVQESTLILKLAELTLIGMSYESKKIAHL